VTKNLRTNLHYATILRARTHRRADYYARRADYYAYQIDKKNIA
jgi:hypothetical protein